MGDGAELGQHERGALVLGQLRDVAEQVAYVLAALGLGRQVLGGRRLVSASGRSRRARSIVRQRLRAIAYSHGRSWISAVPSARWR